MAWTGSAPNETYVRTDGVRTGTAVNVQAKAAAVNDTAVLADVRENDFATALNLVLKRDGGNAPTAAIPWNSQKITGLGQGTVRTDAISLDQVQDGDLTYAEASGTANAIALTTTPTCTPVEGMVIGFFAEADSTSTVTVDLNGGGALALQVGGSACTGGEVNNGQFHYVAFDGTQWQLVNPHWSALVTRATLGLATTDSPMFTAINLGHASDTTLTRVSAGVAAIEGVTILTTATGQPLDAELTAIAGLTSAADKGIQFTGAGTAAVYDLTAAGKALLDDADAAAQRTTLGLGTISTQAANNVSITGGTISGITDLPVADGGTGASTAATARASLGVAFEYISSVTASTASNVDFALPSGYAHFVLRTDLVTNSADGADIFIRFSQSATFLSGASDYAHVYAYGENGVIATEFDDADSSMLLAYGLDNNATSGGVSFILNVSRPLSSGKRVTASYSSNFVSTATPSQVIFSGCGRLIANTNSIDGIRILPSSGTITGQLDLYGWKAS